jgi:trans-aconitate methyltransferase
MPEWNATTYHRISDPQVRWGLPVLDRLPLEGHELVLDVGCGTGRLTEQLALRLPLGRVVGIDTSLNMLRTAREHLMKYWPFRVSLVAADAARLPVAARADAVFSTASFHWVLDHPRLFRSVFDALRPGGRLVAQCGGGPNLQRLRSRSNQLMARLDIEPYFRGWTEPWHFADAVTTADRLRQSGFAEVHTSVSPAPTVMGDADTYGEFISNMVLHQHLARLPADLQTRFIAALVDQGSTDAPPFELDYWRLNIEARRPG